MTHSIQHINPEKLAKSPAFSQAVMTQGSGKTIYIGGQNSVNQNHEIVGKGDIAAQTEQVMLNIQTILEDCGATFDHIVKLTIYLAQGQDAYTAFQAAQKFMSTVANPPAITVPTVFGLGNPDYLVEIDAVVFIPLD